MVGSQDAFFGDQGSQIESLLSKDEEDGIAGPMQYPASAADLMRRKKDQRMLLDITSISSKQGGISGVYSRRGSVMSSMLDRSQSLSAFGASSGSRGPRPLHHQ